MNMKLRKFKTCKEYKKFEIQVKSNSNIDELAEIIYNNLRKAKDINLHCFSLKAINQVIEALYIARSISLFDEKDMFDITISPYPDDFKEDTINLILNKVTI